ncbi:Heterokaryon incompatibility protein 6, OR allele [Colletotrichum sp. SAR 10_77]|nr:Heterokaryon incompatibility protein 6, OR allele [Colletotrichum sp. SAR 10_77]
MVIYPPLDAAKHEIRLVRLLRPLAEHAKPPVHDIALELRTVSLDDEVSYATLSYVWGDPADTKKIEINGCMSVVTRSLHNALEQFQKNVSRSWLWIDAVCIEQSNLAEKNHQVKMMGNIYSVMDLVSRFGPALHAGGALDLGMKWGAVSRLVQEISAAFPEDNDYDEKGYEDVPEGWGLGMAVYGLRRKVYKTPGPIRRGVEGILTRSYWSRIWIIQEVVLARRAVVMVGTRSAPVEIFDATLFTMDRTAIISSLGLSGTTCLVLCLGTRRTCGREDFTPPRLQDLLWERRAASVRPHYVASDPRDLVFGLLGLLSEEEKRDLRADYAQSYVDVFAQATRTMLRTGEKGRGDFLFCLADLPPGNPEEPLPTWVPDWREVGARGIRTWGVNDARKFRAARDRPQPSRESGDYLDVSRILRRRGCLVDKITDVMEAPEWIGVDSYEPPRQPDVDRWFRTIVAFVGLGPDSGSGESYVWRTVSND